jgi:4-aminobutyrate aminotransferase
VFFANSGTEANETALMLATQYRRSNQILALRNSFHGRAFATVAVTGNRGWSASSLSPVKVSYVHGGYRYRGPFADYSDADYVAACVEDLRDVLQTTTSGDVAAMIAEPIQGVGGFNVPPDGLLGAFKEVLDEHGILFISDEVQTGWGRTGGHFWGIQSHGVTPDAMTFANGLVNGLAIWVVIARGDLMDCLPANSISTFGGNPLSTAGAKATLDYLLDNDLQGNAAKQGDKLLDGLRDIAERYSVVGDVRGKGLMVGIELVADEALTPAVAQAEAIRTYCLEQGVLVGVGGVYGNVVRIQPPLVITRHQLDAALGVLWRALAQVAGAEHPALQPVASTAGT